MTGPAQGTTYAIRYVSGRELSREGIDSIFRVIDHSLSIYQDGSLITMFNRTGRVKLDEHMRKVVVASLEAYRESEGAFDITSASLSELWGFRGQKPEKKPSRRQVKKRLALTGSKLLMVRGDSLLAQKKGVQIDCNGIAQGYTVDVIFHYLKGLGLRDFMVELGGEVRTSGQHPERGYWSVGVEGPSGIAGDWHPVQMSFSLNDQAITTSGSYRNFVRMGSVIYGHVIDPRKGSPVQNEMISVSVIADNAMTADAYDNIFFVWGVDRSLKYLQHRKQLSAYFVFRDEKGVTRDTLVTNP